MALHPQSQQFWAMPRSGGGDPNWGTMIQRVLTDFEVRVIAVVMEVLGHRGVRVSCTYEYDGVKVSWDHWSAYGAEGRTQIIDDISEDINE